MYEVVVLIPCLNEETTISKVVSDFKQEIPEAEIFVYDNNSSDNTIANAKKAGAIIRHEYQQGKGNVIRRMFAEIDSKCYILVDGDDTYSAKEAKKMTELVLNQQKDMVVGDRLSSTYHEQNTRMFHDIGNEVVCWTIKKLFHSDIKDIMTGYRAFSYRFVKTFPVLSKGFEIETEMSIHAVDKNLAIENVTVGYRDRQQGSISKLNTFSDGMKVLSTISRLFRIYKPAGFFGVIAVVLFLISTIFLIPVLIEFSRTGLVERFPTLIACGFGIIAALLSFFAGQILNTINQKNRQDFELELIKAMDRYRDLVE